jgi:hypothetical protein
VVISYCIGIRISFLGRAVRMDVHEDFVRVGPPVHECVAIIGTTVQGGT